MTRRNKLLVFWTVVLFIILVVGLKLSHSSEIYISPLDMEKGYVIVKEGWTLSGIAYALWDDYNRYQELAHLNNLENPNIISVGQKIVFRLHKIIPDYTKEELAKQAIWERMKYIFKFRHGVVYQPENSTRTWALKPLEAIEPIMRTPDIRSLLKESSRRLQWVDMIDVYQTLRLIIVVEGIDQGFLQTAIAEQESNYRDVDGSHGEIGVCQIKPKTGLGAMKHYDPSVTEEEVEAMLKVISINISISHRLIQQYGSKTNKIVALTRYNAGIKKNEYSADVMRRYYIIYDIYQKLIQKEEE